jgi:hypothetical protein
VNKTSRIDDLGDLPFVNARSPPAPPPRLGEVLSEAIGAEVFDQDGVGERGHEDQAQSNVVRSRCGLGRTASPSRVRALSGVVAVAANSDMPNFWFADCRS